jgi:hypothetical protein
MTSSTNQHRLQRIRDLLAGQQRRLPVTPTQHPVPAPEVVVVVAIAEAAATATSSSISNGTDEEKSAAAAGGDRQQQIKRPLRTMTSDEAKARATQCFKDDYEDHHHPAPYEDDTRPGDTGGTPHYHENNDPSPPGMIITTNMTKKPELLASDNIPEAHGHEEDNKHTTKNGSCGKREPQQQLITTDAANELRRLYPGTLTAVTSDKGVFRLSDNDNSGRGSGGQ